MKALVVTNPFPGYEFSEIITDPAIIKELLASDHAGHVHVVELPEPTKRPSEPDAD